MNKPLKYLPRISAHRCSQQLIIFCASYHEISLTLRVISEHPKAFIYVVSYDEAILDQVAHMSISSISTIVIPKICILREKILQSCLRVFWAKYYIYRLFAGVSNAIVYFFVVSWGYEALWGVQCLSSKNSIYYVPSASLSDPSGLIKSGIRSFLLSTLYAMPCPSVYSYHQRYRPIVDAKFLDFLNAEKIPRSTFDNKKLTTPSRSRILFLYSMKEEIGGNFFGLYTELAMRIIKSFSSYIDVKQHPRDQSDLNFSDSLNVTVLPKDEPGSLYIFDYPIIIGYASSLLTEASNCPERVIISLASALQADTNAGAREYLRCNQGSGSEILFPLEQTLFLLIKKHSANFVR